ncbi:unnamed protein product, partial [Polarella glacialis]
VAARAWRRTCELQAPRARSDASPAAAHWHLPGAGDAPVGERLRLTGLRLQPPSGAGLRHLCLRSTRPSATACSVACWHVVRATTVDQHAWFGQFHWDAPRAAIVAAAAAAAADFASCNAWSQRNAQVSDDVADALHGTGHCGAASRWT